LSKPSLSLCCNCLSNRHTSFPWCDVCNNQMCPATHFPNPPTNLCAAPLSSPPPNRNCVPQHPQIQRLSYKILFVQTQGGIPVHICLRSSPLQCDWRRGPHIVGQSVNCNCSIAAPRPTSLSTPTRPRPSTSSSWLLEPCDVLDFLEVANCTVLANEIHLHNCGIFCIFVTFLSHFCVFFFGDNSLFHLQQCSGWLCMCCCWVLIYWLHSAATLDWGFSVRWSTLGQWLVHLLFWWSVDLVVCRSGDQVMVTHLRRMTWFWAGLWSLVWFFYDGVPNFARVVVEFWSVVNLHILFLWSVDLVVCRSGDALEENNVILGWTLVSASLTTKPKSSDALWPWTCLSANTLFPRSHLLSLVKN